MGADGYLCDLKRLFAERLSDIPLFTFDEIPSTNTEAKKYALAGGADEAFFIAASQSAGRGRMGRSFSSSEGGLYLSYLLRPPLKCSEAIKLTVFAAVCVCRALEELAGVNPDIKWVNDVYLGGRKLSGILTEGAFADDGESFSYAVVGIGVNLHKTSFSSELVSIATDLETECGVRVDIAEFAVRLGELLSSFEASATDVYMEEYRKRSFIIGREVTVKSADGDYPATAVGIDPDAKLIVRDKSNKLISLYTGEVSIKI